MSKLFPYPLLTLALTMIWLLLTSFSAGNLILGSVIAVAAGLVVSRLHLSSPTIRRFGLLIHLGLIVGVDIIRSNIAVARIMIAGPDLAEKRSDFLEMQLRIRDRNALALLAIIVTATPGTAWLEYDPSSGKLLLHVLDLVDAEGFRALIQNRYEAALMEIFE
ncbi:MAG: Na+/H+ antiporter subunit E [Paracoccus sp. (in: a-proteobacteria)]|uniref:Na+/H+ antiporter subunit E n=1 Tax=Paracoccus sp. TaxID=267 RepID=UPI0026DF6244|nr:Na+/H+ antiporter subunit E [Paracoccus sp. (in: a-proteobacteria)]MDO5613400.1 Na+/H+ antiporter subunit E [Paracoccus sp. (in: a-proteobacteria)]